MTYRLHRPVNRKRAAIPAVLLAAVLTQCSAAPTPLPEAIVCHTQFRPEAESPEDWQSPELTVELNSGEILDFDVMMLEVTYTGNRPDGNAVTITVSDATGNLLHSGLYQHDGTGDQLATTWSGGTSFTGLLTNYADGASLQVLCGAAQ